MTEQEKDIFIHSVYDIVRMIPYGRATCYGCIARAIGHPNRARMVGKVLGESDSLSTGMPAHRVLNSEGKLTAKRAFGNMDEMQKRLESEGILVKNDKVVNWKQVFWNPLLEIGL